MDTESIEKNILFVREHWKKCAIAGFVGIVFGGTMFSGCGDDEIEEKPTHKENIIFKIDNEYSVQRNGDRFQYTKDNCTLSVKFRLRMDEEKQPVIMQSFREKMEAGDLSVIANYANAVEVNRKLASAKLACRELIPPLPVVSPSPGAS